MSYKTSVLMTIFSSNSGQSNHTASLAHSSKLYQSLPLDIMLKEQHLILHGIVLGLSI